jgi:mRNA-degrading endonuclease toxin of MazEF toxin-antitoxin module
MPIIGGSRTFLYAPSQATLGRMNAAGLAAKDLEQGILKVDSKVRADTITSIEQEIILKKIGRVRKEKYHQVVNLVQKLIDGR